MAKVGQKKVESAPAQELEVVRPGSLAVPLPEFMQEDAGLGMEDALQYIRPPRLKVVQKQSGEIFLEQFNVGDVILSPQMFLIAPVKLKDNNKPDSEGMPFFFTPLFFFAEWMTINPIEVRGSMPMIRCRTTNPNDPLVAKCRNQSLWFEKFPDLPSDKPARNVEALNFIILIHGIEELEGQPVVMSFQKGEHRSGSSFLSLIKMRKTMFGANFMGVTNFRPDNPKGQWYGIDVMNPSEDSGVQPFITNPEEYAKYKQLHLELKDAHAKGIVQVDYEDDVEASPADSNDF